MKTIVADHNLSTRGQDTASASCNAMRSITPTFLIALDACSNCGFRNQVSASNVSSRDQTKNLHLMQQSHACHMRDYVETLQLFIHCWARYIHSSPCRSSARTGFCAGLPATGSKQVLLLRTFHATVNDPRVQTRKQR